MKLTVEQALSRGAAALKNGKIYEAESFYKAVLRFDPSNPDANYGLGVLAVSSDRTSTASSLFKTALEANPKSDKFWLSYIDVLIKERRFEKAEQSVEQARRLGVDDTKLGVRTTILASKVKTKLHENISPPQEQLIDLIDHYRASRYSDTEKLAKEITQRFPGHQLGWKVLSAVLKQTGRSAESIVPMQKAVQIAPRDAEAHSNLGATQLELGDITAAVSSCSLAVELNPSFAEAHNNLGGALQGKGRLNESAASFKKAIELKPDYAEAHSNLGNVLKELGRLNEAFSAYIRATNLNPGFDEAHANLGKVIRNVRFHSPNQNLYPPLTRLLSAGNLARPKDLAPSILNLLRQDPFIKNLLQEKKPIQDPQEAVALIADLDKHRLLHLLMRVCPLPDLEFEKIFVSLRRLILINLAQITATHELIYFLSTLSIHCFINEYIYVEKIEETQTLEKLETDITQAIANSRQPEVKAILCFACFRPLHLYNWSNKLETVSGLNDIKTRLIDEPLAERSLGARIPTLGQIEDNISRKVRVQYEENPYPRWVKTGIHSKARTISQVFTEANLCLHSERIREVAAPSILVAGCGTGQHSIGTACRFSACQVTAVDLSLTSLAYAKRKTDELGITNLSYLHADILSLNKLDKKFDIIESVGVLHHMDEPMVGWRILSNLLKPNGLIKIGLYSELARQHIASVRNEIQVVKASTSETDIREFRSSLIKSRDKNHKLLTTSSDFFSLSSLRDLIFHVQEHRFTLSQIKDALEEFGLKFCGFEHGSAVSNFKELYGNGADIYDLTLWHQYEKENPRAFAGMYQFWCQKE
ncbi:MAG: tetratricopeptide repeat protein [Gammaproteobacteria bacterium]|nr:tetratricopeptide repeat protein [Gammaproteobacteria bacterium]